jgi:hypothetical protein
MEEAQGDGYPVTQPNKGEELTASSGRCDPASGSLLCFVNQQRHQVPGTSPGSGAEAGSSLLAGGTPGLSDEGDPYAIRRAAVPTWGALVC